MNESQLARDFMKDLRKLLPKNAVIFRHVTLYASGIPDYSVTCNGKTLWLEFKSWVGDRKPEFQMLQAKNLKKLDGWKRARMETLASTIRMRMKPKLPKAPIRPARSVTPMTNSSILACDTAE